MKIHSRSMKFCPQPKFVASLCFRSTKIPSFAAGREKLVRGGKPHGHALERVLSKEAAPKLSDHSHCQLERQKNEGIRSKRLWLEDIQKKGGAHASSAVEAGRKINKSEL